MATRRYGLRAEVRGAGVDADAAGEVQRCLFEWDGLPYGHRLVFFACDAETDRVRTGEADISELANVDPEELYAVVKREAWHRFMLQVAKAQLTTGKDDDAKNMIGALEQLEERVKEWKYDLEEKSEIAMQDEVRLELISKLYDLKRYYSDEIYPLNEHSVLVQCVMAASPVQRVRDCEPVFTVEACGDAWAVTSYWPAPLRHTAFAGVPVAVQSAGGLTYEVVVSELQKRRLQLVV